MRAKPILAALVAASLVVTIPGLPAYAAVARMRVGGAPAVRLNIAPQMGTAPRLHPTGALSTIPTLTPSAKITPNAALQGDVTPLPPGVMAPVAEMTAPGDNLTPNAAQSEPQSVQAAKIAEQVRVETAPWAKEAPAPVTGSESTKNQRLGKTVRRVYKAGAVVAGATGLTVAAASFGLLPTLALSVGLVSSILLHELAHLVMLRRLGDDTSKKTGQKLSPLALIDPWGTVIVPLLALGASTALLGVPVLFGWAKPVPVDFNKLADPKKDPAKVALAGPLVNLAAAALGLGVAALTTGGVAVVAAAFWKLNLALAVLNMLPLPHLDGGKVLVRMLPGKLYDKWVENRSVAPRYRSTFRKLYEGPSALLNHLHVHEQAHVNNVTRALGLLALVGFFALAWGTIGMPLVLLMLACSYDYYCIREKIQNEKAVQELINILQGFAVALAKAAQDDDSVQSEINAEEVEHVLKNAFEDMIDQVVDSEGFMNLDEAGKWARFESAYLDAAVKALKSKGMSADSEETIRRVLTRGDLFAQLRAWIERNEVWGKWHSPARKNGGAGEMKKKDQERGKLLGMSIAGFFGNGFLGAMEDRAPKSFDEALDHAAFKFTDKEKGFLRLMLVEMRKQKKAPVTGRVEEMNQVASMVTSPRGVINSVVLIGKAGVGKTAIPEKLAQALNLTGTFGLTKFNGRFLVKLNLARLLQQDDPAAALDGLLQLINRMNEERKQSGNRVILFVDEIHQIFEHPKGPMMANLLKEPLRDGELTLIAATTEAEYKKYMENDDAFRRRLVPFRVGESSVEETLRALQGSKAYYEDLYGVKIDPAALDAAAKLSKYDQEVFLPGRAFQYLTLAAGQADFDGRRDRLATAIEDKIGDLRYASQQLAERLGQDELVTSAIKQELPDAITLYNAVIELTKELVSLYAKRAAVPTEGAPVVNDELVKEAISKKTGVASGQLTLGQEPMEKYLDMEKIVGKRVIGQDEAVHTIAEAVRMNKASLSDPNQPLGVFYLTGPTGTGKTHLAKELARFLFNDPDAVVRLDMSEYMHDHEVSKMIGAPPGYVGYGQGGQLTEKVRKKPYSVVLLDEIEKAHPSVWLLLLQVLSEGRLTDGEGRTVDFKNTIILMTSNLGMFAVDVKPYEEAFLKLKEAARNAPDDTTREVIELQKLELAKKLAAETKALAQKATDEAFRQTYPPEFKGRLHAEPIVFNRLMPGDAEKIVELNLAELKKLLAFAGHELVWTPAVAKLLAEEGFSITLGARPLQNAIRRLVTQPLANEILRAPKGGAKKIDVTVKEGAIAIALEPLPAKPVTKRSLEEGAAQEVFTRVLDAVLSAAANHTGVDMTLEAVDGWVRGAPLPAAAESAAAAEAAPVQAPFELAGETFTAAHNELERKDAGVRAARQALEGKPLLQDWLKLFVEQAKKMGDGPVVMRVDGDKAAVERPGKLGDKERTLLETHFGGRAPEDENRSRSKAEALNVIGKDGRRLWFELHRMLASHPGARLGWDEKDGKTRYWIEVPPLPEPPPAPPPPPAPEETTAALDGQKRGLSDPAVKAAGTAMAAKMRELNYQREARIATFAFLRGAADELKAAADSPVTLHWGVNEHSIRVRLAQNGLAADRVRAFIEGNESLRRALTEHGATIDYAEGSVQLTIPAVLDGRVAEAPAQSGVLGDPVVIDHSVGNPADMAFHHTKQALLDRLRSGEGERRGESPAVVGFLHAAVGWAKEKSRQDNGAVRVNWMIRDDEVTVAVTRDGPTSAADWQFALHHNDVLVAALTAVGASLFGESAQGSASVWITYRRPAPPQPVSPVPQPLAQDLKGLAMQFSKALLAQGEERGPTLRMTAAETIAALATAEDLEQARLWLRNASLGPETAAGALIVARFGNRGDDGALIEAAMGRAEASQYSGHLHNPLKSRLKEAYAKLNATHQTRRLLARYLEASGLEKEALYLTLAKHGGPEAEEVLLRDWTQSSIPLLVEYYKRVRPAYLESMLEPWRRGVRHDGAQRLLVLFAAAEFGDLADFQRLKQAWSDNSLDNQTYPLAGQAMARMAERLGAGIDDVRGWLGLSLTESNTFSRLIAGTQILGAAGVQADLAALESIVRFDPARVSFVNEMTQHEAAVAWARLLHRSGLVPGYIAGGQLQAMLSDRSAVVNKAALEALQLHLTRPVPDAPRVAAPAPREHPFYKDASPGRVNGPFTPPELPDSAQRLGEEKLRLAAQWLAQWKGIIEALTGALYVPETRVGDNSVVWMLRQAASQTLNAALLPKVKELVILLLYLQSDTAAERERKLAGLERDFPNVRDVYETLRGLSANRDVTMGLDHQPSRRGDPERGETELWLKFDLPEQERRSAPFQSARGRMYEERWERANGRYLHD